MLKTVLSSTLAAVFLAAGISAQAGTATLRSADGDEINYEYRSDAVRMGTDDADGYSLIRDGKMYGVMYQDGEPMVIDASSMLKSFSSLVQNNAPDELTAEIVTMKKTSRKETVAGISGRVYEVTVKHENGEERTEEVVLSTDRKAREFTDALFLMAAAATPMVGEKVKAQTSDKTMRLDDLDSGVQRYGADITLTELRSRSVSPESPDRPTDPVDMGGLGPTARG